MSNSRSKPNVYMLRAGRPKIFGSPLDTRDPMPSPEQMKAILNQLKNYPKKVK